MWAAELGVLDELAHGALDVPRVLEHQRLVELTILEAHLLQVVEQRVPSPPPSAAPLSPPASPLGTNSEALGKEVGEVGVPLNQPACLCPLSPFTSPLVSRAFDPYHCIIIAGRGGGRQHAGR